MKNIIFLIFTLFPALLVHSQNEEPTETKALLNVMVTDFEDKPRAGEIVIFLSEKTGKSVRRQTDQSGKFKILLPKGDTYKVKYMTFLNEKESSVIEIPEGKGIMEATLTVQMGSEENETYALDIHFESAKSTIRPESYPVLEELLAAMNKHPITKIEIAGHTDSDGGEAQNLQLSKDRAAAVREYLVKKGVAAGRIQTTGYGESRPVADNNSDLGKAKNRRTEIRVVAQ